MFKSIWTFFLLFLLLTQISCQSLPNKTNENKLSPTEQTNQSTDSNSQSSSKAKQQQEHKLSQASLPNYPLSGETLFVYMLGELSKQNKDYIKAFENFYGLALKTRDPRIAKSALRVALETNNKQSIYNAIQLWAELEPKTVDSLQIRTVVLLKLKKDKQAIKSLLELFNLVENNQQNMSRVGVILSSLNDYSRIKPILLAIKQNYPNDYYVDLYIAKFSLKFNDYNIAETAINNLLQAKPKSETAFLLKANLYKKKGMPEKQRLVYESALELLDNSDNSSLLRLEYVKLLLAKNQRKEAIEQLEYIVDNNFSDNNILFSIGMLAIDIKEYDHARKYFTLLYQLEKHQHQGAFLLGVLAYKEEKRQLALSWFSKVKGTKYEYEALLRMAIILSEEKKYTQSVALLDNYLATLSALKNTDEVKQRQLNLLRLKADILYQAELFDQAYAVYTQALEIKPKNAELLYSRAMVAEKLGKIDLTEKDLLSIIKDDPKNSSAFNALGFILTERTTRYDDARKYIEKALQIMPNDMAILDSMGWVLYKMGRLKESLSYLQQAYEMNQDPEIAAHYGEALWAVGDKTKAKEIWQQALINHPEHVVLKSTMLNHISP